LFFRARADYYPRPKDKREKKFGFTVISNHKSVDRMLGPSIFFLSLFFSFSSLDHPRGAQAANYTSESGNAERTRHCFLLIAFCRVHRSDRRLANEASVGQGWQNAWLWHRSIFCYPITIKARKKKAVLHNHLRLHHLDPLDVSKGCSNVSIF